MNCMLFKTGERHSDPSIANFKSCEAESSIPVERPGGKLAAQEAKRRSNLPERFWELVNKPSCIRESSLKFFDEDMRFFERPLAARCCSRCNGSQIKPPPYKRVRVQYIQVSVAVNKEVQ